MKAVSEILPDLFPARPMREDEYWNEAEGLLYCTKCHTRRQTRVTVLGSTMTPRILCQCQQKQADREETERKQREFFENVNCKCKLDTPVAGRCHSHQAA
jgi:DNA replication protein DnaC